ncbi:multiple inositol polyphosphate phosphatase 1-like [Ischnura elegans]|uniref:multiple inositol polyphosphate phosphatase 1-like n=1 Tax=Ischnura elegans TaxID=197161 RepID=UPI001ED891C0|nr:multiple inositol polyphosphate phosphatase 1-like [Ischnura elegans]
MLSLKVSKYYFILVLSVFALLGFVYGERYCYQTDKEPYLHFATKTAYEFVFQEKDPEEIPGCEPAQVWMLARHGTRNPSKDELGLLQELNPLRDEILRNHEARRNGELCYPDKENLKKWQLKTGKTMASTLATQGKTDMALLGSRMRMNFPSLFREGYREDRYVFRHTQKERTRESAEIFAKSIFGHDKVKPEGVKNDGLIKSYSNCTTWEELMDKKETFKEVELFEESVYMQSLIKNVSRRLGFKYNLTLEKIDAMYDMCRYDKSWNLNEISAWCACFSKEELQVLEYRQDLRYYIEAGYGNDINIKLGCPLVKDFVDKFRALNKDLEENQSTTGEGNHQPRGIFYFTHSKALLMLLARLGIRQDEQKLTHEDYRAKGRDREWKTSLMTPFSANLVVVFYNCPRSPGGPQVMMYLQGRKVNYKGCRVGLCSWKELEQKLAPIADTCDLSFCDPSASSAPDSVLSQKLVLLVTVLSALSAKFLR